MTRGTGCSRTAWSCWPGSAPASARRLPSRSVEEGAQLVIASRTASEARGRRRGAARRRRRGAAGGDRHRRPGRLPGAGRPDAGGVRPGRLLINNAFRIPPMDPLTVVDRCPHPGVDRDQRVRAAAARVGCSPTRCSRAQRLDHHAQLGGAVAVAAGVRRLQADQGRAAAPRAVAGHRARAARHPGELGRAELHLRGRQQGLLRLAGQGARRHPPGRSTTRRRAVPTSSRLATADEVADAALLLASRWRARSPGMCLDASCGEFHR